MKGDNQSARQRDTGVGFCLLARPGLWFPSFEVARHWNECEYLLPLAWFSSNMVKWTGLWGVWSGATGVWVWCLCDLAPLPEKYCIWTSAWYFSLLRVGTRNWCLPPPSVPVIRTCYPHSSHGFAASRSGLFKCLSFLTSWPFLFSPSSQVPLVLCFMSLANRGLQFPSSSVFT